MIATPNEAPFPREEFERRLANVRRRMSERGLRTFLTHTPENIYYLTGYQTPGYYMYQTLIVPEEQEPIVLTRLIEEVNVVAGSWIQNRATYQDTQDPAEATYRLLAEADLTGGPIGVERDSWFLSINQYERLRTLLGPNGRLLDASGLVEGLRVVKSDAEIALVRKAAVVADAGTRAAIEAIAEGRTEREVAAVTNAALIREGGEYMGLPTFMGSGPRVDLTHATWTDRRLEKGDSMFIELSGNVRRYSAALFRTVHLGNAPPKELRKAAEAAAAGLNAVIEAIRPGVTAHDVDRVNREAYAKYGFNLGKRTGYSIGINFPPDWGEGNALSLQEGEEQALEPGMVFHVPSTVSSSRALRTAGASSLGAGPPVFAAVSETILVTPTGREVLTNCPPRDLILKG